MTIKLLSRRIEITSTYYVPRRPNRRLPSFERATQIDTCVCLGIVAASLTLTAAFGALLGAL